MLGFGLVGLTAQGSGLVVLRRTLELVAHQVDHVFPQIKQTAWLFQVFGYKEVLALNQSAGKENVHQDKKTG